MPDYRLENDVFVIENYDKKAPFCSFLPGLAGEKGIPLWSFYVNRGQGMTGDDFARLTYLMRTYFTMLNAENNIPVFLNQVSGEDGDDVKLRAGGYFCMSFDKNGLIPPIYDPYAIFGEEYSFITPLRFTQGGA